MNLFPHFITRLGGLSYNHLDKLSTKKVLPILKEGLVLDEKLTKLADRFSELMFDFIAEQSDKKVQNRLLNLKRDVHKLKRFETSDIEKYQDILNQALQNVFVDYIATHDQIQLLEANATEAFEGELIGIREHLVELSTSEALLKGLLLSSQPLLHSIQGYKRQDFTKLRKKELKTEESLVKYLTRMAAKTSPFSTFTNLAFASYTTNKLEKPFHFQRNGEHEIYSHISLNNNLFGYLKGLMLRYEPMYKCFQLRLNPTISLENETYFFLTNHNNVEAFQRMPHNGVLELFQELLTDHGNDVQYQALVDEIIKEEYIEASEEEISAYIKQLIDFGFIEFNLGVSGIDPNWDSKLIEVLNPLAKTCEEFKPVIEAIANTRQLAESYAKALVHEREGILKEAHDQYRSMCMVIHEKAGLPADERKSREEMEVDTARKIAEHNKKSTEEKEAEQKKADDEKKEEDESFTHEYSTIFLFKPEQMFYEDTTCNLEVKASNTEMESLLNELKELLYCSTSFDGFLDEMEKMSDFFQTAYPNQTQVPLMKFYEDFFREVKVPEAKNQQDFKDKKEGVEAPKLLAITEARRKLNQDKIAALSELIKGKTTLTDQVNIPKDWFAEINGEPKAIGGSFGAFVQPFYDNGELKLMANSYFPGNGKMFSRFLHILPEVLTNDLREYNNQQEKETIYIENCDASMFNANLHPPLMPYEIWMPGGQNTLPAANQIPITDLEVCLNKEGTLELRHKEQNKKCYVFDLGFQGQRGRSQLFQLLARFSPTKALMWYPLTGAVNNIVNAEPKAENGITILPRITYNNKVVLQRKRWVVPKEVIPSGESNETEFETFNRLNKWRLGLNIPNEVFVFLTNQAEQESLTADQLKKMGRDGYKPQYINFGSPVMVNLLNKLIEKAPLMLRLEEMLPAPQGMITDNQQQAWVSELVVQWYDKCDQNKKDKELAIGREINQ